MDFLRDRPTLIGRIRLLSSAEDWCCVLRLCLTIFFLVSIGCVERDSDALSQHKLSIGDSKSNFEAFVAACGGKDITSGLAMAVPAGQKDAARTVWEFADFECVLSVSFDDNENLAELEYCELSDFLISKGHRSESTFNISGITFKSDGTTSFKRVIP